MDNELICQIVRYVGAIGISLLIIIIPIIYICSIFLDWNEAVMVMFMFLTIGEFFILFALFLSISDD